MNPRSIRRAKVLACQWPISGFRRTFFSGRNPPDPVTISSKTLRIVSLGLSGFFRFFRRPSVSLAFGLFGSVQICSDSPRAVQTENWRWSSLLSLVSSSSPDANQCTAPAFCSGGLVCRGCRRGSRRRGAEARGALRSSARLVALGPASERGASGGMVRVCSRGRGVLCGGR